ncbi:MAG: Rieske 2Fe-2S domain-containing protein [Lentisphaeria bacterium]|nr:Rieske 2Fe-2S domain-containing protein [Lentisphaeria bacterium]NQZ71350.1 Rieske 2Fe-2S domain-containing protein [Lentisphaeria bacterium]
MSDYQLAASLSDFDTQDILSLTMKGNTIAIFKEDETVYAIDNRCPHMGFPMDKGSLKNGIVTCHWHHARFCARSGGAFDQWADDIRSFPVEIRDGEIFLDVSVPEDRLVQSRKRLIEGMERNISLVISKSIIRLLDWGEDPTDIAKQGLAYGSIWGNSYSQGMTILTCMTNLLPYLNDKDKAKALFHGLSAIAGDCAGQNPRFLINPFSEENTTDSEQLKNWFRDCIEVRDRDGADRCLMTALSQGADDKVISDMLFSAATDHRYINTGHVLDSTNKAFEALDICGWDQASRFLGALVTSYTGASRSEENKSWLQPEKLGELLLTSFERIPEQLTSDDTWQADANFMDIILGDDTRAITDLLISALENGAGPIKLSALLTHAAASRVAFFHTSNDLGDWNRVLHSFTYASAIHRGLLRSESQDLVRGIFDVAMTVYLDRFLNIPKAKWQASSDSPEQIIDQLPELLNQQQMVNETASLVEAYLEQGAEANVLIAKLGELLLRENRNFHSIQMFEAAVFHYKNSGGNLGENSVDLYLVAAGRYIAAHAPSSRQQEHTFRIANRLHKGEKVFED